MNPGGDSEPRPRGLMAVCDVSGCGCAGSSTRAERQPGNNQHFRTWHTRTPPCGRTRMYFKISRFSTSGSTLLAIQLQAKASAAVCPPDSDRSTHVFRAAPSLVPSHKPNHRHTLQWRVAAVSVLLHHTQFVSLLHSQLHGVQLCTGCLRRLHLATLWGRCASTRAGRFR